MSDHKISDLKIDNFDSNTTKTSSTLSMEKKAYIEHLFNVKLSTEGKDGQKKANLLNGTGAFGIESFDESTLNNASTTKDLLSGPSGDLDYAKVVREAKANSTKTPDRPNTNELAKAIKARDELEKELLAGIGSTGCVEDFATVGTTNEKGENKARWEQATKLKIALGKVRGVLGAFTDIERGAMLGLATEEKVGNDKDKIADWNQLRLDAIQERSKLTSSLPPGYNVAGSVDWPQKLIDELKPYWTGDTENQNALDRTDGLQLAKAQKGEAKNAGTLMTEAVKKYQTRGMSRASTFFDSCRNGVAMSVEDMEKARQANDQITKLGTDILSNGGTYSDVKALMKETGLTEEFWPPKLVRSVQAWRKTQRALQEERVRKLVQNQDSEKSTFSTDDISTTMQMINGFTELDDSLRELHKHESEDKDVSGLIEAAGKSEEVLKTISEWMNGVSSGISGTLSGLDILKSVKDVYENHKDDKGAKEKALKDLQIAMEDLAKGLQIAVSGMTMAKDFGGTAVAELMKKVIPGVSMAAAGVELAAALKDLSENIVMLSKTKGEKNEAYAMFVHDDVDEATINVMSNAVRGEKIKTAKSGVKVGTAAIEFAGSTATTFGGHHGAVAGAALTITASGINLGSKAIFSGIDWSAVKKAKKTLQDAQAGSMEAQVQIFEDSNFYAKMYLAILAKEKNPLALKYLVDRGIEEGDLDKPTSLELLRSVLLETAEQTNDQEEEFTIFEGIKKVGTKFLELPVLEQMALATGVGSIAVGMKYVGISVGNVVVKAYEKKKAKPYHEVPPVMAPGFKEDPDSWAQSWVNAKKIHIANGLIDRETGLGAAISKAAEAHHDFLSTSPIDRDTILSSMKVIQSLVDLTHSCKLMAFNGDGKETPHKPAGDSLISLRTVANKIIQTYWAKLADPTTKNPIHLDWDPPVIGDINTVDWDSFWKSGKENVAFPNDDAGVKLAIAAAVMAKDSYENAPNERKKRQNAVAYADTLDQLTDALLDCLGIEEVNRWKKACAAINTFMLTLNSARQDVDNYLGGQVGGGNTDSRWPGPSTFDTTNPAEFAQTWAGIWNTAVEGAFVISREEGGTIFNQDVGLGSDLAVFAAAWKGYETAKGAKTPDPQGVLKNFRQAEIAAGRVKKTAIAFCRTHRYSAEKVKELAAEAGEAASHAVAMVSSDINAMQNKATFTAKFDKIPEYLSSQDWRVTYESAVANGAVLESGTAKNAISGALKDFKKALAAYEKGVNDVKKKPDDRSNLKAIRKLADAYREAVEAVDGACDMVKSLKGYSNNAQMAKHLDDIKLHLVEYTPPGGKKIPLNDPKTDSITVFDKCANGTAGKPKTQLAFNIPSNLSERDWKINSDLAKSYGVIPDKNTGITEAIKSYLKSRSTSEKRSAAFALQELLEQVKEESNLPSWTQYVEGLISLTPAS